MYLWSSDGGLILILWMKQWISYYTSQTVIILEWIAHCYYPTWNIASLIYVPKINNWQFLLCFCKPVPKPTQGSVEGFEGDHGSG